MKHYLSNQKLVKIGGTGWEKNASKINGVLLKAASGDTIVCPEGEYPVNQTITQLDKTLNWECAGCTFLIYHKEDGFVLKNTQPHALQRSHFDRITLVNRDGGLVGFRSNSLVTMYFPTCSAFKSHGMHLRANEDGEDLSGSIVILPTCGANGGDGVRVEGGDANQVLLIAPACAGNTGVGVNDWSFLGITLLAPMCHNNVGGDYHTEAPTARTLYLNPYGEQGGPPNEIHGATNVIGGLVPNGWKAHEQSTFQTGRGISNLQVGPIKFLGDGDKGSIELSKNGTSYSIFFYISNPDPELAECPHYVFDGFVTGRLASLFEGHPSFPATYRTRKVPFGSFGFEHVFIGERFFVQCAGPQQLPDNDFIYRTGDTIYNSAFDPVKSPEQWICTKQGTNKTATWKDRWI